MKQKLKLAIYLLSLVFFIQGCTKVMQATVGKIETTTSYTETPKTNLVIVTSAVQKSPTIQPTTIARKTELPKVLTITSYPILSMETLNSIKPGEYLIYTYKKGMEIASVLGQDRQLLASIMDDWTNLSPNKQFLAYSKAGIPYLYEIKNNLETRLIFEDGSCIAPDWSPDSQTVVFSCQGNDGYDLILFFMSDLSHEKLIDCALTKDFCQVPKWSPDGRKIAYIRKPAYSGESVSEGLYILNTECLEKKNCGTGYGPFPFMNAYAWSPDSNQLAGISHEELYIYEYKDRELSTTNSLGKIGTAETIVWSPDGNYLGISPIEGYAYRYSLKDGQVEILKIPSNARLRGWVIFP